MSGASRANARKERSVATAEKKPAGAEEFTFPDEVTTERGTEADGAGEVEVEIVDDTPPKDKGRKALEKPVTEPTDEELEGYSEKVQARIKELTHARHDERRRAEALTRERDEAINAARQLLAERKTLAERFNTGQEAYVSMAKEKAEADLVSAKAKLKKAHDDFDNDAIVEAQAELAAAVQRVENAKTFKPTPVQMREDPLQREPSHQETPQVDEKTLSWQARNQWFGGAGTEAETSYALGVHANLVAQGITPGSDAYFAQIDARMKSKFPELYEGDAAVAPSREPSRKPASVAAPAARTPRTAGKVQLTRTQVALAQKLGVTPQQYAAQMLKLQENQR
jgi:hypothetical protein